MKRDNSKNVNFNIDEMFIQNINKNNLQIII